MLFLNIFNITGIYLYVYIFKYVISCTVPVQEGLQQVSGVLLVNNFSDDVRGLVMKRFITYDDVCVLVIHSKHLSMLQRAVDPTENT